MTRIFNSAIEKLQSWADSFIEMLPNLAVALVVLAIAALIGRFGRRLATTAAQRFSVPRSVRRLLGVAVSLIILAGGLFVALEVLNLDKTVTSLLAGAGVAGLAIGFAAQSLISNLLSGVLVSVRGPFREGDFIETLDHSGTVELVDLRVTKIRTPQGQLVLIPNKQLLDQPLTNHSSLGRRRVDLEVGVSYSDDLSEVETVALEAVGDLADRDLGDVELFFTEFGDSSINLVVRFWVPFERPAEFLEARSRAIMRIKEAFDEHGINIPFPIRTLDLAEEATSLFARSRGTDQAKDQAAA